MRGNYDFELLVTPEEFKRNKKRHQKAIKKEHTKDMIKNLLFYVGTTIFVVAMVFGPAAIENLF